MRRHYTRQRKSGPTPDEQLASHVAAGLDIKSEHPALYVDLLNKASKAGPLAQRSYAIKSLRSGDELVIHDAATLGVSANDINGALIEIGRRGATLIVWTPEPREYLWNPEAAEVAGEMSSLAADAASVLLSEKHRRAGTKNAKLGAQPKLVGRVREIAMKHWQDPSLTAKQAHTAAVAESGVRFSLRLMQMPPGAGGLGKKMDAEIVMEPPRPKPLMPYVAPIKPRPKTRTKRRGAKRP